MLIKDLCFCFGETTQLHPEESNEFIVPVPNLCSSFVFYKSSNSLFFRPRPLGMVTVIANVVQQERVIGLWRGLVPVIH